MLTINNLINLLSEDETSVKTLDTITCADTNEFPFPSVTAASITYTPTTNCPSCLRLEPQGKSTSGILGLGLGLGLVDSNEFPFQICPI